MIKRRIVERLYKQKKIKLKEAIELLQEPEPKTVYVIQQNSTPTYDTGYFVAQTYTVTDTY